MLTIDPELAARMRVIRLVAFDFDGVFTDNSVYVSQDGTESVRCVRSDGMGLRKLDRLGIQSIIISTEANPVVSARSAKLAIRCIQNCPEKSDTLRELLSELKLDLSQVAFVGNDVNDASCLKIVGLPIIVADAHDDVASLGRYRTKTAGGYGAVREICDLFELAHEGSHDSAV